MQTDLVICIQLTKTQEQHFSTGHALHVSHVTITCSCVIKSQNMHIFLGSFAPISNQGNAMIMCFCKYNIMFSYQEKERNHSYLH